MLKDIKRILYDAYVYKSTGRNVERFSDDELAVIRAAIRRGAEHFVEDDDHWDNVKECLCSHVDDAIIDIGSQRLNPRNVVNIRAESVSDNLGNKDSV
jgi:hypothetical protein